MEAGDNVLAGRGMAGTMVIANVCLYVGDEVLLIVGGDHCMATRAGQAEGHWCLLWGGE
jgi:hypothetical protein